jgi:hypothetical protein
MTILKYVMEITLIIVPGCAAKRPQALNRYTENL